MRQARSRTGELPLTFPSAQHAGPFGGQGAQRGWRLRCAALLLACALSGSPARAQGPVPVPPSAVDSLLQRGRARVAAGDTAAALLLFAEATARAPRSLDALFERGRLLTRTIGLGLSDGAEQIVAWRVLNRGAELAPRDARFALELARLRLRTPLLRADAERLFRNALSVALAAGDQAIAVESRWELGRLYERRFRTMHHRHMYTGTIFFDQFAARSRLHYIRDFVQQQVRPIASAGATECAQAEQWYRDALATDPRHTPSAIGLSAMLIEQQRFEEAFARITPLLRDGATDPTLWFAGGLAALRLGRAPDADELFAGGIARLAPHERAEVVDIGRLLTTGDSVRIAGVSDSLREATRATFWESIDPLLSTSYNEARLEYLSRIATTMLRYDDPDRRLRGWQTDRGQIVVRYGEAPVEVLLPSTDNLAARDAAGRLITVFYYPTPELGFVFSGALAMSDALFAGDFRDIAQSVRERSPFRLDNLSLIGAIDSMPTQIARFRGRTNGEYEVVLATAAPVAMMYRNAEIDRGVLALSLRVGGNDRMRLIDSQQVVAALPRSAPVEYRRVLTLPSGERRLRLEGVDPAVRGAKSRAHVVVDLPASPDSGLSLSDLLLARPPRVPVGAMRQWSDATVDALAGTRLSARDTFALYWEAYALRPDSLGDVAVEVELTVTLVEMARTGDAVSRGLANVADLLGLTPEGDERLSMRFTKRERLDGRDRVPQLVSLSVGEAPIGRYRVEVTVRDLTAGTTARTAREFTLSPP